MTLKKIASIIFILATIITYGQTEKGKILIGTSTNFGSSYLTEGDKGFTTTTSDFNLSLNSGYSLINNLFLGVNIQFSSNKFKIKYLNSESNVREIVFSPFLKYYFLKEKIRPFALIRYGFGNSNYYSIDSDGEYNSKSDVTKLNLGGGISYFFTDYFGLEFEAFYQRDTSSKNYDNDDYKYYGFKTNLGISFFF